MNRWLLRAALSAALLTSACADHAATVTANPGNAQSVITAARGGDRITLAAGNYEPIVVKNQQWDKPVTVDATAAQLQSVTFVSVANLVWRGGDFNGSDSLPYGFVVRTSTDVSFEGARVSHYMRTGLAFDRITGGRIAHNSFSDMGSDGMDVALSRRILIDGNTCSAFVPLPGAHPDCIQSWSRPSDPPTADLTIVRNTMDGSMQGISLFNHVRDGVDDGGFDRIVIARNKVHVSYPNGIAAYDCRDCVVRDNDVDTVPGSGYKTSVRLFRGSVTVCSNKVPLVPASGGDRDCPRTLAEVPGDR